MLREALALADTELTPAIVAAEVLPGRTSSERLVPAVRRLMEVRGLEVERTGCGGGGAWAGVVYRGASGLSAAKGLSEAGGVGLIAVSRLALLAAGLTEVERRCTQCWTLGGGSFITGSMLEADVCARR